MPAHFASKPLCASALALALASSSLLSACGGGGGSDPAAMAAAATPAAPMAATSVADIVPGAGMAWATAADRPLQITVTGADGLPAAGAGLRVFSLSRTSPHDGAPLDSPVPVSLLDSAVSDAAGHISLPLQLPAHLTEVLLVATLNDTQAQRAVATDGSAGSISLSLAR